MLRIFALIIVIKENVINNRVFVTIIGSMLLWSLFASNSFANSSWHWITQSPLTVLPAAVILTLLIETLCAAKFGKIKNVNKTLAVVTLANILSFIAPAVFRAVRFIPTSGGFSLSGAFSKGPYYIVLTGYLLLTLLVELPMIYFFLKNESLNKKRLLLAVLICNITTTLMVAVFERMICVGVW